MVMVIHYRKDHYLLYDFRHIKSVNTIYDMI